MTTNPDTSARDAASAVVLLLGIYQGAVPLVARLLFGREPFLALPLRLPSPWWWIVALGVIVGATGLLAWLDASGTVPAEQEGAEGV